MWFVLIIVVVVIFFFSMNKSSTNYNIVEGDEKAIDECVFVAGKFIELASDSYFNYECLLLQIIPIDDNEKFYSSSSSKFKIILLTSFSNQNKLIDATETAYIDRFKYLKIDGNEISTKTTINYKSNYNVLIPRIYNALVNNYNNFCTFELEKSRIIIREFKSDSKQSAMVDVYKKRIERGEKAFL